MSESIFFFERAALPATPWKNGGGLTREIACQPPGAGLEAFDWRISIAHIASDGPFSLFSGVDRVITLLEGAGVQLEAADGSWSQRLDQPWQPLAFAGDHAVHSRLLAGPCEDLNVMTRRGRCRAEVRVLRGPGHDLGPTGAGLLLALQGDWQLRGRAAARGLRAGQGLCWQGADIAWRLDTDDRQAALVWVRLESSPA